MVFFAFSAVQVGAQQDGMGSAGAPGFKVDGANMTGDAICPEGGCDSSRGTAKSRDMKGNLDMTGSNAPAPQANILGQEKEGMTLQSQEQQMQEQQNQGNANQ